ncbi:hypothetical protein SAMN05216420_11042 [Nitrosospira sp. Nl5]|uniref:hypothetical protein n=1 Tax=Nitrosospira sp. Nl5 TaxID=200120 RepID=UPI000883CED3|nr:hypothetical protein [Nitrosospira sp. Nl5]SCY61423.1 hypothetical protein SAMN05216420_11042 [Nitrosospira sp. Nl5]
MAEKDTTDKMEGAAGQFTDIVKDLFNIEVNTILKDKISAQKMPSLRHAMVDIGKEYFEILREMELSRCRFLLRKSGNEQIESRTVKFGTAEFNDMRRGGGFYTQEEIDNSTQDDKKVRLVVQPSVEWQLGGFGALDIMCAWADRFLEDPKKKEYLENRQLSVLPRIKDNADMLKGMFSAICRRDNRLKEKGLIEELKKIPREKLTSNTVVELSQKIDLERTLVLTNQYTRSEIVSDENLPPLPVKDSELLLIRKVWEVGTEVIAMQTTIQVDGDVITRLNLNCMDEHPDLLSYHNAGVTTALCHWKDLITIAKELVLAVGRGVASRLS